MRTSSVFLHYTPTTTSTTTTTTSATTISPTTSIQPERSPWHSPIPYLFGGLAAMLALIAFALLILACSYWKLSADDEDGDFRGRSDVEQGKSREGVSKPCPIYEEKILVIMAGNDRPTCLATPRFSKADLMVEQGNLKKVMIVSHQNEERNYKDETAETSTEQTEERSLGN